jgi:ring-1,2-phenylacetyl-CoA epoxidase subunit PaaC
VSEDDITKPAGSRSEGSVPESAQRILELADDELILGWRNSEWTGIAPFLEEDVAFSSIAQTEIGHARAWYELAARRTGRGRVDADALAFDRDPDEYRCAPFVEPRLVPDWAQTIARHWLYETADAIRIEALKASDDPEVAGLAEKIDREEAYHRMHADMWAERLRDEARFRRAVDELWPSALGLLEPGQRDRLCETVSREPVDAVERGEHTEELRPLWEEMTMVRRSVPGASW